jgi:hypothetical protein
MLTHRQLALLSENAPPITGPRIAPVPQLNPSKALYRDASLLVANEETYVKALGGN